MIEWIHIPKAPHAVTGISSWWGLNPNGTNDTGDLNADGTNSLGAFGHDNHNEQIVGASLPIILFHRTVGEGEAIYQAIRDRRYLCDVLSHTTGRHITGVELTDLGPGARLHRPLDLTYAANKMLGHTEGLNVCTVWITGPDGIMEIKGWDFANGCVTS